MKQYLKTLSFIFVLASLSSPLHAQQTTSVIRTVDGDTLKVRYWGKEESKRFIGTDTPESRVIKKAKRDVNVSGQFLRILGNIITFVLGVIAGVLIFVIHGMYEKRNERKRIQNALIMEISYMHRSLLSLELDDFRLDYPDGPYKRSITRDKYDTTVYDHYLPKIINLLNKGTAIQVNYYYSLVKELNTIKDKKGKIATSRISSYLRKSAHAYRMLFGTNGALIGKKTARKELKGSVKDLMSEASKKMSKRDKDLLKDYGQGK